MKIIKVEDYRFCPYANNDRASVVDCALTKDLCYASKHTSTIKFENMENCPLEDYSWSENRHTGFKPFEVEE